MMTGLPYLLRMGAGLRKPKAPSRLGTDFAGKVEAIGADVTRFQPGDAVYGMRLGAFADYLCVREDKAVAHKATNLSFEQAASVPVAAITALQALRDKGGIQAGHRVLIIGASGGVGTFAVQIAKALGAHVTGVCSGRNIELVGSIGADEVIDYTKQDFTRTGQRYDLILDNIGDRSVGQRKRVMNPNATLVVVGGPKTNRMFGPMTAFVKVSVASRLGRGKLMGMLAQPIQADLVTLTGLLESGKVTPVIDKTYLLPEVPKAVAYLGEGHARGKVVVSI